MNKSAWKRTNLFVFFLTILGRRAGRRALRARVILEHKLESGSTKQVRSQSYKLRNIYAALPIGISSATKETMAIARDEFAQHPTPEKMAETRALQIFFRPIPYSINFPPPTSFAQAPEPLPVRAVCPFLIFFALITLQLETFDPRK